MENYGIRGPVLQWVILLFGDKKQMVEMNVNAEILKSELLELKYTQDSIAWEQLW